MKEPFVIDLKIDIYKVVLNVVIGDNVYDCIKRICGYVPRDKPKTYYTGANGMFFINYKTNNWILAFNKNNLDINTISHECFHATVSVMHAKGITFGSNFEAEEAYAYLIGFIIEKVDSIAKSYTKSL